MEASEPKSNSSRKWKLVAAVAVTWILLQGATQLVVLAIESRNSARAAEIYDQAKLASKPTWTMDDAKAWLKSNGFVKIMTGEGTANEKNEPSKLFKVVTGSQQIYEGSWFTNPMTVHIDFRFGTDFKFQTVEYDEWPFQLEGQTSSTQRNN